MTSTAYPHTQCALPGLISSLQLLANLYILSIQIILRTVNLITYDDNNRDIFCWVKEGIMSLLSWCKRHMGIFSVSSLFFYARGAQWALARGLFLGDRNFSASTSNNVIFASWPESSFTGLKSLDDHTLSISLRV